MITSKKWDSGLKVVVPEVYLAPSLEDVFGTIQDKVNNNEYSVLLKGEWDSVMGGYYVSDEYYIPLQEVAGASVDYHQSFASEKARDVAYGEYLDREINVSKTKINNSTFALKENLHQLRKEGYSVIAHSHPFLKGKGGGFSSADDEHINSHYPCSLLLNGEGEVVKASLLMDTGEKGLKIRVQTDEITSLALSTPSIDIPDIDKIHMTTTTTTALYQGYQRKFPDSTRYLNVGGKYTSKKPTPWKGDDKVVSSTGDKYLGDGLWHSDVEREVNRLVNDGHDEDEVRSWYGHYYKED